MKDWIRSFSILVFILFFFESMQVYQDRESSHESKGSLWLALTLWTKM